MTTGAILARILVCVLFALVALPSISQQHRNVQSPAMPAKPYTLAQVWTMDATYSNEQHGVTFRYPRVWKATTQFGYHAPALTSLMEPKPIAGFGYSEGGFPRSQIVGPYSATNLEGFGIVYSAIPTASAVECEARASLVSDAHQPTAIVLGERSFSVRETGEGGMSQSTTGHLYATYARPICYLFETDVAMASSEVLGVKRALTPAQLRFINTHLLTIMKSVRIVPTSCARGSSTSPGRSAPHTSFLVAPWHCRTRARCRLLRITTGLRAI